MEYVKCVCFARGGVVGVWGDWLRGLRLDFTDPVVTGECETCVNLSYGGVGGSGWLACTMVCDGGVVLCLCVLSVWIHCVYGRSRYLYIVLVGSLRILVARSVQSCCTLSISAS